MICNLQRCTLWFYRGFQRPVIGGERVGVSVAEGAAEGVAGCC